MDYKAALAKIAEHSDAVEAIMAHVSNLNSESMNRRHELTQALEVINALKKIAGDDTDLVNFTTEAKKKTEASDTTIADLQTKLDAALVVAATEQRLRIISKAAQLSNANETALAKLLEKTPTEQIILGEKDVKISGKELRTFAEETEAWMLPSLFPTAPTEAVPTGGASPAAQATPAASYLNNKAAGLAKSLGLG